MTYLIFNDESDLSSKSTMLEINSKSLVFIIKNIGKISDTKRMKYYFRRENSDETFCQIFKPIAQNMKIIELHAISKKSQQNSVTVTQPPW